MNEMTIQELVAAAKAGNDKARRVAWSRIISARETLWSPKFRTMRIVSGKDGLAKLKETIDWASKELQGLAN